MDPADDGLDLFLAARVKDIVSLEVDQVCPGMRSQLPTNAVRLDTRSVIDAFTTERLRLRPLRLDDVHLLFDLNSDVDVMRYITGRPSRIGEVEEEVKQAIGRRWLGFDRGTGEFVGWVGAVPTSEGEYEVGWRFRRAAWGRGLATEAACALIRRLFADGATRVFAQTMAINGRSRALMERLGLHFSRTFHVEFDDPLPGTELGEVEYELERSEWEARSR